MQISSLSYSIYNNKSYKNKSASADLPSRVNSSVVRFDNVPSIAFRSLYLPPNKTDNVLIKELKLAKSTLYPKAECYFVEIFNKAKNRVEKGALMVSPKTNNQLSTELTMFDSDGVRAGYMVLCDEQNHLKIDLLKNQDKSMYAGVGSRFIQVAAEINSKKQNSDILVYASNNALNRNYGDPFLFYYSKGFSVVKPGEKPRLAPLNEIKTRIPFTPEGKNLFSDYELATLLSSDGNNFEYNDENLFKLYHAVAKKMDIPVEKVKLRQDECMYLSKNTINKDLIPQIEKTPILSEENRVIFD